ncbi:MAG TPA: ComEC/Rec2 family competence protein, partial [Planctomycetia bacterium]|nr:ComEC/Rec2 family competence protein [Planctomycetia bacterium]
MGRAVNPRLAVADPPDAALSPPRLPLVPIFLGVMLGIFLDEYHRFPAGVWAAAALVLVPLVLILPRSRRAALSLLVAAALGGEWHRLATLPSVAAAGAGSKRLSKIRGTIASEPLLERAGSPSPLVTVESDATEFLFSVADYFGPQGDWLPANERVAVRIRGAAPELRRGDRVEISGWWVAPAAPANPGDFVYSEFLRQKGVRASFRCDDAGAVVPFVPPERSLLRLRDEIVRTARDVFQRHLTQRSAGLAEASLLGAKSALRQEDLEPFFQSGTLHLLVVSGWHVAVLALIVWRGGAIGGARLRPRVAATLLAIWTYVLLTGGDPPAVRAAVTATCFFLGDLLHRPTQPLNSIAASGIVILALQPGALFQAGAQLSFVAVLGLVLFARRFGITEFATPDPLAALDPSTGRRAGRWIWNWVVANFAISTIAFAVTAPLAATRFHLFSPAAILLSIILAPVLLAGMGFAALLLLFGGTPLAPWFAVPVEALFTALAWMADFGERIPGAFTYVAGPPVWWVAGFYALLFGPWCRSAYRRLSSRHAFALKLWIALGAAALVPGAAPVEPEFHQLSVGHGNCAVFREPEGRVVLFDVGSISGPRMAERTVANWLWRLGIGRIDALFISHADIDHFNGLPGLVRRFRIRAVYAPPQFASARQSGVGLVYRELVAAGAPLRFTWAGDRFALGEASLDILHPPADFRGANDNANSLVSALVCRGYRVLNTADLEKDGSRVVRESPATPLHVLVAPHHGGRTANTPEFAAWAAPRLVFSSQGDRFGDHLGVYRPQALALRTDQE